MRLMAVDDEPDILKIVELSLARWGYVVDGFTDPVAALDHFRANALDYALILTDIRMPEISGAELARRAKKIKPGVKVMIMTAFEVDRDLKQAVPTIESSGFLRKPFHTADVCVAVKRHLAEA